MRDHIKKEILKVYQANPDLTLNDLEVVVKSVCEEVFSKAWPKKKKKIKKMVMPGTSGPMTPIGTSRPSKRPSMG